MIAVWTATGLPMAIGKAVLDPKTPTLFGELPADVEFQRANLRVEEVDGPDSPSIDRGIYRDEHGETHDPNVVSANEAEDPTAELRDFDVEGYLADKGLVSVEKTELDALSTEKERQGTEIANLRKSLESAVSPQTHETVVRERDGLKGDVVVIADERDQLKRALTEATQERDSLKAFVFGVEEDLGGGPSKDLQELATRLGKALKELPTAVDPNPALVETIAAVLSASAGALERLPEEALAKLAGIKGIDPLPESKAKVVEALKAEAEAEAEKG